MEKIDKRIHYFVVLDTETCPLDRSITQVTPDNMWVYDCGWAIVDKRGKVYRTRSFVNSDIFLHEKIAMNSAYYANKLPKYWAEIEKGERTLASFYTIRQTLIDDMAEYNTDTVFAHNMRFDLGTLNTTERWLTKSKYRYFFPYGTKICDTLKMSRDILGNMPTYRAFCEENDYLTSRGQPRFTAEIIYRFISTDYDFCEEHTGLADVLIEKEILAYCYKQHKKMRKLLFE